MKLKLLNHISASIALAAACLIAACQQGANVLATMGVAPDTAAVIAVDAAEAGQLFCSVGPSLIAVSGVNVKGAGAEAVAHACAVAQVAGVLTAPSTPPVPVPGVSGALAIVAQVAPEVIAAVESSRKP